MFSLIYAWINDWVNNREAGDLRRQHGHYDVIVMLRAKCQDSRGNYPSSELDLNTCVTNVNGALGWHANGNFYGSVRNSELVGAVLKCETRRRDGTWCSSELNLDEKIWNDNGKLACGV